MLIDFLIIGQGLAGTLLALELLHQGAHVVIIDNPTIPKASTVAAGLLNPVTGQRLVKSWDWERAFDFAKTRYLSLSSHVLKTNSPLFNPRPILRLYQTPKEQSVIQSRRQDPDYQSLIAPHDTDLTHLSPHFLHAPLGAFEINNAGYVDLSLLISSASSLFLSQKILIHDTVNLNDFKFNHHDAFIEYKSLKSKNIIFTQGASLPFTKGIHFFDWLPFRYAKGDILILESALPTSLQNYIINFRHWILPLPQKNTLKLGATFEWDDLDYSTSSDAQSTLLHAFTSTLPHIEYKVIHHLTSIRPCTTDNKPFIGQHPTFKNIFIFNGFGAKGSLYAPLWAHLFSKHLSNPHAFPLESSVNINRFLY